MQRDYDSTIVRMAGNIAAGLVTNKELPVVEVVRQSVAMALAIVEEAKRLQGPK